MHRITVTFLLLIALQVSTFSQPEKIIQRFIVESKVPGIFVAVVQGDSVLYQKSLGFADKLRGIPLTDTTCMELGSISKVFTAEAIYYLNEKGLLNVQDPIRKYLPNSPTSWSNITIQHLLNHTSGIQNYLLDPRFKAAAFFSNEKEAEAEKFFNTITPDEMVKLFYTLPLEFSPGTTWSYSNTGYYLLGKIGEVVTAKPFFELVEDKVTTPLKMYHTKANELAAKNQCLARGYFQKDSFFTISRVLTSNYAFSAGAWATTGRDMIRYLKAIHNRNLPSDKTGFDWRKTPFKNELPFTYNAGRFYTTFHGLNIISHNGGTPGFSSSWIYVVEKNISIIILMNLQDYAAIDQLAWNILSFFEHSLKYPQKQIKGEAGKKRSQKIMAFINAVKYNKPYPGGLGKPLEFFLNSENGKGYWKWYFERGFPESARCVDVEQTDKGKLYRFLLTHTKETVYQLSVLENECGDWTQIRWW